jgi:hypothetical protein
VALVRERTTMTRQNMGVIRQLGWQWKYAENNCCSEKVKRCILTTEVLFSPALILTSEHNQNGVLIPTPATAYTSCIPLRLTYNPDKALSF